MSTTILQGDCLETLKTIEAGSVQTCVTSPPYYGLRDYGTAKWEGGALDCDHTYAKGGRNPETSSGQLSNRGTLFSQYEKVCKRCGALRVDDQIGLEETPEIYVEKLVQVFREVRRVLKDDGTLWLNLGDSYNNSSGFSRATNGHHRDGRIGGAEDKVALQHPTIKTKDLLGIPWMVAFALRADGAADWKAVQTIDRVRNEILGTYEDEPIPDKVINVLERLDAEYREAKGNSWYLRSDIIWHKPNPMPESVTDRPTKSHEHIFLFSKSATYYYDAEAIKEPSVENNWEERLTRNSDKSFPQERRNGIRTRPSYSFARMVNESPKPGERNQHRADREDIEYSGVRNKRDVWTVNSQPYRDAHFATFPPKLIEPCILAGSRVGDIVLDPFNGSGTTGAVAIKHHRNYIGCELNPDYICLTNKRLGMVQPVLFPQAPS